MIVCYACGKPMRVPFLIVAGASYGPKCGRALLVRKRRAKRRDAGVPRKPKVDTRQLDWVGGLQ